jgi:hypothetical protein
LYIFDLQSSAVTQLLASAIGPIGGGPGTTGTFGAPAGALTSKCGGIFAFRASNSV